MTPTLADLLADPSLALSCVTGHRALHRPVTRVHVAEIGDPSPWLARDVLLLTTGLVERTPAELDAFFGGLAERGVAAVGFGVGFIVERIPAEWVAAADAHGMPLLSVPLATPYIAISEFVSRRLADQQLDQVRRMLDVQQRLAYSEATPEQQVAGLERLADELEATVFWLAPEGLRRTASGPAPADPATLRAVGAELSRHLASGRSGGSASVGPLFLQLASTAGSPIAVARERRYTPLEQGLIGSLATFIDLSRDTTALPGPAASLREQILTEAVAGRMPADPRLCELLFAGTAECTAVFLAPAARSGTRRTREPAAGLLLKSALSAELADGRPWAAPVLCPVDDGFVLVLPAVSAEQAAPAVGRFLEREAGSLGDWCAGVSGTRAPRSVPELCAEARRAHAAAAAGPGPRVLRAEHLGRRVLVSDWLASSGEAPVFADWRARLALLDAGSARRILGALRAFLAENGALERAAAALGVHRQTLKARLAEAEDRLGVSLAAPTDRALLWIAFESGALGPGDQANAERPVMSRPMMSA